jgi:Flp pilus assembly pilin Flp
MKTALIVVTLIEVALLVAVLAVYLIAIAGTLRKISSTLGLVTFGVRAIEKQTEPIGPVLGDINAALEQVAGALEQVAASGSSAPPRGEPGLADRVFGRDG